MKPVDVIASQAVSRQFQALLPALQETDPDNRQKAFVAVAWTFVREGDIEEALKVVDLLTPEYVQNVMPGQMERDPAFDRMAEVVANALVEAEIHRPQYTVPSGSYVTKGGVA